MPEAFDACHRAGGRIRTISGPNKQFGVPAGYYLHVCFTRKGKMVRGEMKKKDSATAEAAKRGS